ncbi:hypothetical protein ACFLXB_06830 [Chloroflexota bacterium]
MQSGNLPNLKTSENDSNHIRLIARGNEGYLYINGSLVSKLDLSMHDDDGDVCVATGFTPGYEINGYKTHYENFEVWSLASP